jgi:carbonic anhydrase
MRSTLLLCTLLASLVSGTSAQAPGIEPTHSVKVVKQATPPEQIWADLMAGNKRFVAGKMKVRDFAAARHELVSGQHPKTVVLTCSDSRVPPELLFDKGLGELFVVRSAGNIADAVGRGSIEYAVEHLGSSVLVVLGHEKCGAVTAACSQSKMPTENLQAIVDQISPAVARAGSYAKSDELIDAAIRENVDQSAKDILAHSEVLRHALKEGKLTIFEAVYKLDTGEVARLGKLAVIDPAYRLDVGEVVRLQ